MDHDDNDDDDDEARKVRFDVPIAAVAPPEPLPSPPTESGGQTRLPLFRHGPGRMDGHSVKLPKKKTMKNCKEARRAQLGPWHSPKQRKPQASMERGGGAIDAGTFGPTRSKEPELLTPSAQGAVQCCTRSIRDSRSRRT